MYKIPKISNATEADRQHFQQMNERLKSYKDSNLICEHKLTKIAEQYKDYTDKCPTSNYWRRHVYTEFYGPLFEHLVEKKELNLLEIGIRRGGSLLMWADYFNDAKIYGVDIDFSNLEKEVKEKIRQKNITTYFGNAYDRDFFQQNISDKKFDIIIDDGSHTEKDQITFFEMYRECLNPGGFLLSEDFSSLQQAKNVAMKFDGKLNNMSIILRNHCIPSGKGEIILLYKE